MPDLHAPACKGFDAWLVGLPRLWVQVVKYFEETIYTDICDLECLTTQTTQEDDATSTSSTDEDTSTTTNTTTGGGGGGSSTTTTTTSTTTPEGPCIACVTITNNSGEPVNVAACGLGEIQFSPCGSVQTFEELADGASIEVCDCDENVASIQVFWTWGDAPPNCVTDCGGGFATQLGPCEWALTIGPREDYSC